MATKEEIDFPSGVEKTDAQEGELWGAYWCVGCDTIQKFPVYLYPPHEDEHKGHCTECGRQMVRERVDDTSNILALYLS